MTTTTTATPAHSPDHFVGTTSLGNRISYHESRVASARGRSKLANGVLLFGTAMLIFGGFLMLQDNGNAMCLILPSLGLLGLGALGLWDAKSARDLRLALFDEGIAASEKNGVATLRWDDVERAFEILTRQGNTDIIRHGYRLESANGQKIWWNDDVSRAAQAWETARQRIYPRLMRAAVDRLQRGESVPFGDFTLNSEGLTHANKSLPWNAIQEVALQNGILTLRGAHGRRKEEFRATWSTIPNAGLLLTLVEQMRR